MCEILLQLAELLWRSARLNKNLIIQQEECFHQMCILAITLETFWNEPPRLQGRILHKDQVSGAVLGINEAEGGWLHVTEWLTSNLVLGWPARSDLISGSTGLCLVRGVGNQKVISRFLCL